MCITVCTLLHRGLGKARPNPRPVLQTGRCCALAGEALFPSQGRFLLWPAYTLHLFDSVCIVNIVFQNALEAPLWLLLGLCGLTWREKGMGSGGELQEKVGGESRKGGGKGESRGRRGKRQEGGEGRRWERRNGGCSGPLVCSTPSPLPQLPDSRSQFLIPLGTKNTLELLPSAAILEP